MFISMKGFSEKLPIGPNSNKQKPYFRNSLQCIWYLAVGLAAVVGWLTAVGAGSQARAGLRCAFQAVIADVFGPLTNPGRAGVVPGAQVLVAAGLAVVI